MIGLPGGSRRVRPTGRSGRVAVLINNAGVIGGGDALSNPEGWARILGVNLLGAVNVVQRFVPGMVEGDDPGLVVCTGSKQGITQPPGDTAYNVSKSGVKSLTEGLAHTLREENGRARLGAPPHSGIHVHRHDGAIHRREASRGVDVRAGGQPPVRASGTRRFLRPVS